MTNIFNLNRYVEAQNATYRRAGQELCSGRKISHWMWFIFPQLEGLGKSETAYYFSIKSLDEAEEYLRHPLLGIRLRECSEIVLNLEGVSISDIFGYPNNLKFHSSMTLFAVLGGKESVFQAILNKYFDGAPDESTLKILNQLGFNRSNINLLPPDREDDGFSIFAQRVAKSGKVKCGDSFAVDFIEDERILVLAVADGVSSSPCDWKASETACEALLERFKSASGNVPQRMVNAATKAHNAVREIEGRCSGSITSLTFVVWETSVEEIHVLNVGDSRVYLGLDSVLEQITSDDVQPVILKRNGELVLQAGVPVFMRGVTRSLGQTEALEFAVATHEFKSNHILLLVSDGISKNEAFTSEFPSIFSSANISEKLAGLVAANSSRNKDDATLIAVWHSVVDQSKRSVYEDCVDAGTDFRSADLSPIEMVEFIKADLIAKITENENDAVNALLDYSDKFGLRFDRDFLSSFLSLVIKQGTDRLLVARIRDLIRKAH